VERTKNGKSHITYKKYKYRESYHLKTGEIVWRCLGAVCKATIKTDAEITQIVSTHHGHEGRHPVTMAAMSRTPQARHHTPARTPVGNSSPRTPAANTLLPTPGTDNAVTNSTAVHIMATTPTHEAGLLTENAALRREIAELKTQMNNG